MKIVNKTLKKYWQINTKCVNIDKHFARKSQQKYDSKSLRKFQKSIDKNDSAKYNNKDSVRKNKAIISTLKSKQQIL